MFDLVGLKAGFHYRKYKNLYRHSIAAGLVLWDVKARTAEIFALRVLYQKLSGTARDFCSLVQTGGL